MTPNELLEEVKGRFIVLYHDDPAALERLLRQALRKFQDKAGLILSVTTESTAKALPYHTVRRVAVCCDAGRRFIPHTVDLEELAMDADGEPIIPDESSTGTSGTDTFTPPCPTCSAWTVCRVAEKTCPYRNGTAQAAASTRVPDASKGTAKFAVVRLNVSSRHVRPYRIEYFADLANWPGDKEIPGDVPALLADYLEALIAIPNSERARFTAYTTGIPAQDIPALTELKQRVEELETEMEECKALVPSTSWY